MKSLINDSSPCSNDFLKSTDALTNRVARKIKEARKKPAGETESASFPLFRFLPKNLQDAIWILAAHVPRVLTQNDFKPSLAVFPSERAYPAILQASRSSRQVGLRLFTLYQNIYLNFESDVLFLGDLYDQTFWHSGRLDPIRHRVRNIAFSAPIFSHVVGLRINELLDSLCTAMIKPLSALESVIFFHHHT
ncbi:hypothetical protein B0T17DRAFT_509152 [Bombardia bombarda]|uniref:2EXR domain-containing protein n=1 Tax=Bombardia bombarda TaxID=252184 RepID=A0AA39WUL2_9PEZI|nr:hypothetical protein B0T17DRAFT_509152 [Bombardia bombarda]